METNFLFQSSHAENFHLKSYELIEKNVPYMRHADTTCFSLFVKERIPGTSRF